MPSSRVPRNCTQQIAEMTLMDYHQARFRNTARIPIWQHTLAHSPPSLILLRGQYWDRCPLELYNIWQNVCSACYISSGNMGCNYQPWSLILLRASRQPRWRLVTVTTVLSELEAAVVPCQQSRLQPDDACLDGAWVATGTR